MSASTDLRSRRALLGAGLGAIAATVAATLGRPVRALAVTDNPLEIDTANAGTMTTSIETTSGHGFQAVTDDATAAGLWGSSVSGYGVYGRASGTNPAVLADSQGDGPALRANGRVQLSTSGVATIATGHTSVTVSPILPSVDVSTGSFVLLTPSVNIAPRALWYTTNTTANTLTIHMSSSRSKATKVSWLLLG